MGARNLDKYIVRGDTRYVWVAYRKTKPYLPYAVADSAAELAELVGVKESSVREDNSRFRNGKKKKERFVCVYVGGEE